MKIHGWKIHHEPNRIRLSRGTRHHYLTKIDGRWRQTTKDGAPALKAIPPRDLERVVAVVEGES